MLIQCHLYLTKLFVELFNELDWEEGAGGRELEVSSSLLVAAERSHPVPLRNSRSAIEGSREGLMAN